MSGMSRKRLSTKVLGHVTADKILDFKHRYAAAVPPGTTVLSLDECSFSERAQPLYGYSKIGEPCKLRLAKGGWTQHSVILGISSDGDSFNCIKTGSFNRESFGEFVLSMPYPPGTVILLDNCKIHKGLDDVFDGVCAALSQSVLAPVSAC
jgi:hypothetical protein